MHADPVGTTTASMIVELEADPSAPVLAWMTLGNPCVATYFPVFADVEPPTELLQGNDDPASGGAWWRFRELLLEVQKDFPRRGQYVRGFWSEFERELVAGTLRDVSRLPGPGMERRRAQEHVQQRAWEKVSTALAGLAGRVRGLA